MLAETEKTTSDCFFLKAYMVGFEISGLIKFSLFCIAQNHKLQIFLRGLYNQTQMVYIYIYIYIYIQGSQVLKTGKREISICTQYS